MNRLELRLPAGLLTLTEEDGALTGARYGAFGAPRETQNALLREAARQLGEYFDGKRREFDLPLRLDAAGFCRDVLNALPKVRYGSVRSYGWLAHAAGHTGAARAAGSACARNPIVIFIPCHRILRSDGGIGGYAGGVGAKRLLLELEAGR